MLLNTHIEGHGPPLVLLHGLFGNWENWASRVSRYARDFKVYAMDLRNHGESPHSDFMSYRTMAEDVTQTMENLGVHQASLIGHSMGGKVAMQLASRHASLIAKLVIVDIAPKAYEPHHSHLIAAMQSLNIDTLSNRKKADDHLSLIEPDNAIRAFLLKNLTRYNHGFRWQLNLASIASNYTNLLLAPELEHPFLAPTLFIKGAESDYLGQDDTDVVQKWFPEARFKLIDGAGHWPHVAKPAVFDHVLTRFLV